MSPVKVETVHPAGPVVRASPLAASALAWVGCLAAGAVLTLLQIGGVTVLITAVPAGLLALWDFWLPVLLGGAWFHRALTAAGFAAAQADLLRMLGLRAMAVLGPLYLVAPGRGRSGTGGRDAEPCRPHAAVVMDSLLVGATDAPDVRMGIWMLAVGLVVVLWPARLTRADLEHSAGDVERSPVPVR